MATIPAPRSSEWAAARRLPAICFKLASFTAMIGVSMGVYMGVAKDYSLTPVHVHLNLIGWVSMFLFGLYYHAREEAAGLAGFAQVGLSAIGYSIMLTGLAGMLLSGPSVFLPMTIAGSLMVWAGFVMFFVIVLRTA